MRKWLAITRNCQIGWLAIHHLPKGLSIDWDTDPCPIKIWKKQLVFLNSNTENYPNSSNAFDSLAEPYKATGNNEKALELLQKGPRAKP